jgi:hypothetical protein
MRLWTIHPKHLDPKGLVALWREALLAQAVLRGETRGYTRHPQLQRFREHSNPLAAIGSYLEAIQKEADLRGYRFDLTRIGPNRTPERIEATKGQLRFKWNHLKANLKARSPERHVEALLIDLPECHPLFRLVPGDISPWERISGR